MELTFHDHPPVTAMKRKNASVPEFIAALKQHPGQWAKYPSKMGVRTHPATYQSNNPGTEWVAERSNDHSVFWARWVG